MLSVLRVGTIVVTLDRHGRRARSNSERRIAAEHGNTRTILGTTEGYHVASVLSHQQVSLEHDLVDSYYSPNFNSNDLSKVRIGVDKDPLDEIVAELIRADLLLLAILSRRGQ